ncbi:MAG: glycosyltransferase [Eubacteriales bacterium]|nr:glycosyltransferase [Eubacteriales bacterium]
MERVKVDVVVPTYRPGKEFSLLLKRLEEQDYPIEKILVMNTEEEFWDKAWEVQFPLVEVRHIKKADFDHGGTRRRAAEISEAEIMVFMTQDALPRNRELISSLVRPILEGEKTGAVYARQLPKEDCGFLERYTRSFNYPRESALKVDEDVSVYGIKTYFCSNVCAAYDKKVYNEVGGFTERAIFNEDMIYVGNMVKKGYAVAYAADAQVFHSHNYTCVQQFHRNFDLGVSQAEHPEIFANISSEGEGLRLVKKSLVYLCRKGRIWLIPQLVFQSGFKFMGYFLGKRYKKLPGRVILACTMNPSYWSKEIHDQGLLD